MHAQCSKCKNMAQHLSSLSFVICNVVAQCMPGVVFCSFGRSFVQWTNTFCNSIVLHFRSFSASFCLPFHQVTTAAWNFSCTLFASENVFRHIEIGKFLDIICYSMRPKCLKMKIAHDVVFVGVFTEFTIFVFVESQLFNIKHVKTLSIFSSIIWRIF